MRNLILAVVRDGHGRSGRPSRCRPTEREAQRRYYRNGNYDGPTWRGRDGRYHCRRSNGTTGLIVGGAARRADRPRDRRRPQPHHRHHPRRRRRRADRPRGPAQQQRPPLPLSFSPELRRGARSRRPFPLGRRPGQVVAAAGGSAAALGLAPRLRAAALAAPRAGPWRRARLGGRAGLRRRPAWPASAAARLGAPSPPWRCCACAPSLARRRRLAPALRRGRPPSPALPPPPPSPIIRRTASVAALIIAAPILLALSAAASAAASAASCAWRAPRLALSRTFLLAASAAAAVTRPAASRLRATGFWASSAACGRLRAARRGSSIRCFRHYCRRSCRHCRRRHRTCGAPTYAFFAICSSTFRNRRVTDERRRQRFPQAGGRPSSGPSSNPAVRRAPGRGLPNRGRGSPLASSSSRSPRDWWGLALRPRRPAAGLG